MASEGIDRELTFQKREDLHEWLQDKSAEIAVIIAVRAVLRLVPITASEIAPRGGKKQTQKFLTLTSAIFRAAALARAVSVYPGVTDKLLPLASASAAFASSTAERFYKTADYAVADGVDAAGFLAKSIGLASDPLSNALEAIDLADSAWSAWFRADMAVPFWESVSADVRCAEAGASPGEIASLPLWDKQTPWRAEWHWRDVKQAFPKGQNWEAWIKWYENQLNGIALSEEFEFAFALIPLDLWKSGLAEVNAWIDRHLSRKENIPAVMPATIEPALVGEIVTISKAPLAADLVAADIAAALAALKSRFERLLSEIECANIDQRFPAILRGFIDRLPSTAPDTETLFDMGAELAALRGYEPTVIAEWPSALSPRFSAAVLTLDLTLQKFPKWKEFAATPPPPISSQQAERIAEISRIFVAAMRTEGALEHFDAVVPATLESLTHSGETIGGGIAPMAGAGRAVVVQDELESINNILKVEASILPEDPVRTDIVSSLKNEIKEAGDDVKKGAKEAKSKIFQAVGGALVFGPVAFLTLVAANVSGIPAFEWLLTNFKPQFGWLEPFLRALGLL